MTAITVREITADTVRAICALETHPHQHGYVAPNAVSIAQAHFAPEARFRALYAGEVPVGFMMWRPETEATAVLWRFMIDKHHQGRGYGAAALELLFTWLRREGYSRLWTSAVPGDATPIRFYRKAGFTETGEIDDGEVVLSRSLS